MLDNRPKPSLSQAAFEVLSIVAYNPNVTRAEMERIRGVSSDSALNKLLEYKVASVLGTCKSLSPAILIFYILTDSMSEGIVSVGK